MNTGNYRGYTQMVTILCEWMHLTVRYVETHKKRGGRGKQCRGRQRKSGVT